MRVFVRNLKRAEKPRTRTTYTKCTDTMPADVALVQLLAGVSCVHTFLSIKLY